LLRIQGRAVPGLYLGQVVSHRAAVDLAPCQRDVGQLVGQIASSIAADAQHGAQFGIGVDRRHRLRIEQCVERGGGNGT